MNSKKNENIKIKDTFKLEEIIKNKNISEEIIKKENILEENIAKENTRNKNFQEVNLNNENNLDHKKKQKIISLFEIIKNHRKVLKAPVDSMGCTCIPYTSDDETRKFRILMMLILSIQTKDQITFESIHFLNKKMIEYYGKEISKESISNLNIEFLYLNLKKVNFYKKKVKNILDIAKTYKNKKLPTNYKELIKIKGLGNKIIFLYLYTACNLNLGVSVDTHVFRIFNRIGLQAKNPENLRKILENLFEKKDWMKINKVMVGFGQTICLPKKPKCTECKICNDCEYFKSLEF